jgi:hypothetical protein
MRDLFLAFCEHPFYAFCFMLWITVTVDSVVTMLTNVVRAAFGRLKP